MKLTFAHWSECKHIQEIMTSITLLTSQICQHIISFSSFKVISYLKRFSGEYSCLFLFFLFRGSLEVIMVTIFVSYHLQCSSHYVMEYFYRVLEFVYGHFWCIFLLMKKATDVPTHATLLTIRNPYLVSIFGSIFSLRDRNL